MRRLCPQSVVVMLVSLSLLVPLTSALQGAPPFRSLLPFRRVDADRQRSYNISETNGPWMIMAASFAGPLAEREANELVYELRKRFNMEAYIHRRTFDYTKPVVGLGLNKYGQARQMKHAHGSRFEEIAVMVGNFEAVDHPATQKALRKIKEMRPEAMDLNKRKATSQRYAVFRQIQRAINSDGEKKRKGPMGRAMVTRNPLLPESFFRPGGVDDFVLQMNKGVKYSLLQNPKPYSVCVASFRGKVAVDLEKSYNANTKLSDKLEAGAMKAHELTAALRQKGWEAYEFHDRHESIVSVGGFDYVGQRRPDGLEEIHPGILTIMQTFGADKQPLPGSKKAGLKPKVLAGIPLDVQPFPIKVPRRSVSAMYSRQAVR